MTQKTIILSPHLDDAVLSCWNQIEKPNSQVLTIFTGMPTDDSPSKWDILLGQASAKEAMRLRLQENDNALQETGIEIANLDYLEYAYRTKPQYMAEIIGRIGEIMSKRAISRQSIIELIRLTRQLFHNKGEDVKKINSECAYKSSSQLVTEIADRIDKITPHNARIIASPGFGARFRIHEDHIITRLVAQALIERGRHVEFYLDLTYMLPLFNLRNWPKRISKKMIERNLGINVNIKSIKLSPEQQQRKRAACQAYKTQFQAFRALMRPGAYRWEVIISPKKKAKLNKALKIMRKLRKKYIKKDILLKLAHITIGAFVAVSYVLAMYSVINTNMVPTKYLAFAVPISFLVVALLVFANFKAKKLSLNKKIGIIIASLIMIVANIYVFSVSNDTMSLLNNIQDDGYTYEQYNIIAKTNRHINLVSDNKQSMGIIKTDVNNDSVKAEVKNITKTSYNGAGEFANLISALDIKAINPTAAKSETKISYKDYDELTSLTVALDTKTVDMATVKSSYLQLLKENYNTFYQSIEVLGTFKIKIKNNTNIVKTDTTKPFIIYISGIDTYGDVSTVSRSDVNIMAVINPQTHKILLVNTPRDYYVQLHGTTGLRDKLTHSGIYGIDMSVKTMEDLYSTPINYYLRINFSSLTKIVDTLNGVDVNSQYKFTVDGYSFNVGINHLDGKQALTFSRERHSFEGGDRTRGSNQELVIEAIIAKMNDPQTIINYQQILSSLNGVIQTSISSDDMSKLINSQLNNMSKWNVESISVDGTDSHNYTYSMGNILLYVIEPDTTSLNIARQKIEQYILQV